MPVIIPNTFTGYSSGGACGRGDVNFYYGGADWAFLLQSASTPIAQPQGDFKVHALKSTDSGTTWNELDAANAPLTKPLGITTWQPSYSLCLDGSLLYLVNQNVAYRASPFPNVYSIGLQVWIFDLVAGTWSGPTTFATPLPGQSQRDNDPSTQTAENTLMKLVRRGANDMLLVYNGAPEVISSVAYPRAYVASFDGSSFGTSIEIPNQTGVANTFTVMEASIDTSSNLHTLLLNFSGNVIVSASMDLGGSWGSLKTVDNDYANGDSWNDGVSNFKQIGSFICVVTNHGTGGDNGDGVLQINYANAGDINPSWQLGTVTGRWNSLSVGNYIGKFADIQLVGSTVVVAWCYNSSDIHEPYNGQFLYSKADLSDLTTWTPYALLANGSQGADYSAGQIFGYNRPTNIIGYMGATEDDNFSDPVNQGAENADSFELILSVITVSCGTCTDIGEVGQPFSCQLTASGGTEPYTFAKTAGSVGPGLTLNADGSITGTPTDDGSFEFAFTATDSNGVVSSAHGCDIIIFAVEAVSGCCCCCQPVHFICAMA